MERNNWYLGMGGERKREKKIEYNQVFDTVIEVVAYGYKVDTSA